MTRPNEVRTDDAYDFVRGFIEDRGFSPSVRDIGEALGVGPSTAHKYLLRLREQGRVEWEPGRARTFRVVETGHGVR